MLENYQPDRIVAGKSVLAVKPEIKNSILVLFVLYRPLMAYQSTCQHLPVFFLKF